jgi:heme iron utilization protein
MPQEVPPETAPETPPETPPETLPDMPNDPSLATPAAMPSEAAALARRLVRSVLKATLATIDRDTGHPYPSLVLVATTPDGSPTFLISRLALHTRNLEQDPRAGLLIDGTGGLDDPMTGARITLVGRAQPLPDAIAHRRFLSRHPAAQAYAGFADFSMYGLTVDRGHFIGGFGRIVDLEPTHLLADTREAVALIEAEPEIVAHMNADHADAVGLYATELAGCGPGAWRMTAIDSEGIDLLHCTNAARINFDSPVQSPAEARNALVALAARARALRRDKG